MYRGHDIGTLQQCFFGKYCPPNLAKVLIILCQTTFWILLGQMVWWNITGIWKALMNDCTPTCPNADFWRFGRNSFIKDTVVAPQDVTLGYGNFWFGTGYIVFLNDKKTDFWPSFTTWMTFANWINTLFSWFWFYTPMMVVDVPCRKSLEWIWCWTRRWRYGCARWIQIQVWAILTKKLLGDVRYRCPSYHHHGDLVKFPYQKKVGMNLVAKSWCFFSDLLMFLWVEFGEKKTLVESTWRSFTRRFWDPQIRTTSSLAIKQKSKRQDGWSCLQKESGAGELQDYLKGIARQILQSLQHTWTFPNGEAHILPASKPLPSLQ